MWPKAKRATTVLAIACCCVVLLAATAHLLHSHHSHHKHGKNVADLACSLCTFSAQAAEPIVHVQPQFKRLTDHSIVAHVERFEFADHFRVQHGRAPPAA